MASSLSVLVVAAAVGAGVDEPSSGAIEIPTLIRLVEQLDVPARESGVLAKVSVAEGQMVEEGATLAQIDDAEARAADEHAKAELDVAALKAANTVNVRFAKKSVDVAKAELRRCMESNEKYQKSISESEMDRLRLVVEKGVLEVEQAEHELQVATLTQRMKESDHRATQQRVQRHTITAPLAGVVVQVNRRRGEWVKPGDSVVRILRLDRLRAEGFVKMQSWRDDLQGCPVRLVVDLPEARGAEFSGKVVFVDPEIDPVNAQVRIWAEVENRALQLRPGMRAKMILTRNPSP